MSLKIITVLSKVDVGVTRSLHKRSNLWRIHQPPAFACSLLSLWEQRECILWLAYHVLGFHSKPEPRQRQRNRKISRWKRQGGFSGYDVEFSMQECSQLISKVAKGHIHSCKSTLFLVSAWESVPPKEKNKLHSERH